MSPDGVDSREPDPRRLRRGLVVALALGAAAAAAIAFASGGTGTVVALLRLPLVWSVLALSLTLASWFAQGLSFAALTSRGARGQVWRMTAAFLGGDFAALVTPFGSGGVPGIMFTLVREGLSVGEAGAVVAVRTLLTGAFFVLAGLAAAAALPGAFPGPGSVVGAGAAAFALSVVAVVWLVKRPGDAAALVSRSLSRPVAIRFLGPGRAGRWRDSALRETGRFAVGVRAVLRRRPVALLVSFVWLALSRACVLAVLPIVMYGLGWRGDVPATVLTGLGAMAVAVASPTPGGAGPVEAVTAAALSGVATAQVAGAATLVWRGVTHYSQVLVGWVVFSRYLARPRSGADAAPGEM